MRPSIPRPALALSLVLLGLLAAPAPASINLEWRPPLSTVTVGDTVGVGLYAVSDSSREQLFSTTQVYVAWNPTYVQLTGVNDAGAVGWLTRTGFPVGDAYGLNEAAPPADGSGLWVGFGPLGSQNFLHATPAGALLTTFSLRALAQTTGTPLAAERGDWGGLPITKINGTVPNTNVLGTIGPAGMIAIVPEPTTLLLAVVASLLGARRR
jgi:hypothetical protein